MTATQVAAGTAVADEQSTIELQEGRYHRQELICWWDQERLHNARVLVVGAGALGNELCKALALLGVGRLDIVDMDTIEHSNLARCVLFRDGDEGKAKAEVAARAVTALNPGVDALGHTCTVQQLGLGFIADVDLVVAGLDSREARLWVGRACRKLGVTWVDGAIEGLRGLARVFLPEGACYECTLGEADFAMLEQRRKCALLSPNQMATGMTPTNATTAAIIGSTEAQEAVKILVGREDLLALRNSAWMFTGETLDTYHVSYTEDPWCPAHDRYERLQPYPVTSSTTLAELVGEGARQLGGADAVVFEDDVVLSVSCHACGQDRQVLRARVALRPGDGECTSCGEVLTIEASSAFAPEDPVVDTPVQLLGLPARDVITVRRGAERVHFVMETQSGEGRS
jgi:molybdopterin/thiamine biosynthesis adenylyltransferase